MLGSGKFLYMNYKISLTPQTFSPDRQYSHLENIETEALTVGEGLP